ncbi:MAG TPA: lipoprotein [Burkholderiaceae bacterium]|jgi:predicted small lipoprotein YifL
MLQRKTSVAAGLKAALAVGAWLAVASTLAGCGQKGPLMLPQAAAAASAAAPAASAAH